MLFFCQSQTCSYDFIYDFAVLLLIILFSKKISYLKINGVGLLVFIIVALRLLLISDNHPLLWPGTANIAISQKILNSEYFNDDIAVIAGYYSPKYIYSFVIAKTADFLKLEIINTYYILKIIIVIFTPIFVSFSLYKITTNKEKILYIKSDILRNFVIIFISAAILSGISKLFYNGWSSFSSYNVLYPTTEQSVSLLLGFCGLFFLTYFKSKISLIFFIFSTFMHPVVGICNYFIKIILCLDRKIMFKNFLKKELIFFIISVCIPILTIGLIWNENVLSVSKFIEIYIVERHPHQYLVSYYFNYFSLIILFIPLILLAFNMKKNKELSFFSIVIFLSIVLPTFVQFIFIEIMPLKSIAKLGINRFGIFSYVLILILIVITFQNNITTLINKFYSFLIIKKLNKNFTYLYWDKTSFLILPIFFILLAFKIFPFSYSSIKDEVALSKKIQSLNLDSDKTIQFSKKISSQLNTTTQIRVLSKTSVYFDNFFPFNENFILKWSDRTKKINSFDNEADLICYLKEKEVDFYITGKEANFKSIYNNNKYQLISISGFSCNN